jgi:hypothetical protein
MVNIDYQCGNVAAVWLLVNQELYHRRFVCYFAALSESRPVFLKFPVTVDPYMGGRLTRGPLGCHNIAFSLKESPVAFFQRIGEKLGSQLTRTTSFCPPFQSNFFKRFIARFNLYYFLRVM